VQKLRKYALRILILSGAVLLVSTVLYSRAPAKAAPQIVTPACASDAKDFAARVGGTKACAPGCEMTYCRPATATCGATSNCTKCKSAGGIHCIVGADIPCEPLISE
jgi:hypothetical protein